MRCSVWRVMGKQKQELRLKRAVGHRRNCHQCCSSQPMALTSNTLCQSKAPFSLSQNTKEKTWLLLAMYVDGWRQREGLFGKLGCLTNTHGKCKTHALKQKAHEMNLQHWDPCPGKQGGSSLHALLNHSAHGQHLIPNNNMAHAAHVLTSSPSAAPLETQNWKINIPGRSHYPAWMWESLSGTAETAWA